MRADGTALYHTGTPKQEFPENAGWFQGIKGRKGRPARAGRLAENIGNNLTFFDFWIRLSYNLHIFKRAEA
jgi:hypothetical protein